MKKILAISSLFLMITAVFTGCGADRNNTSDNGSYYENYDYSSGRDRNDNGNTAGDHMKDAIDGVEDAGEDIVGGVGDAAGDIVDGLDGDRERDSYSTTDTTRTTSRTTDRR